MCVCRTVYVKIAQFSGVQTKFLLDLLKIDNMGKMSYRLLVILTNLVILLNSVYGECNLNNKAALTAEVIAWMDNPGGNDCGSDIGSWDISQLASLKEVFHNLRYFNGDISRWDVSRITNLQGTFQGALSFSRNLSSWDTSNVVTMERTFDHAAEFPAYGLENWNVNKVTSMKSMFRKINAVDFNTDLSNWNTSSVVDFMNCFREARSFNADISYWNTASVTTVKGMFYGALTFNRDLSKWDTSKVINTVDTFNGASAFNGNISTWSTSSVTLMNNMFLDAQAFNGNLGQWDTSKVIGLHKIFNNAFAFQGNGLESWNTSSVEAANYAFVGATSMDTDLSSWDVRFVFESLHSNITHTPPFTNHTGKAIRGWEYLYR